MDRVQRSLDDRLAALITLQLSSRELECPAAGMRDPRRRGGRRMTLNLRILALAATAAMLVTFKAYAATIQDRSQ